MIKFVVIILFVKEVEGGLFIFWYDFVVGCVKVVELGYDVVEVFVFNDDVIFVDEFWVLIV